MSRSLISRRSESTTAPTAVHTGAGGDAGRSMGMMVAAVVQPWLSQTSLLLPQIDQCMREMRGPTTTQTE